MLIRYGCCLTLRVERPMAAALLVDLHPERRADVVGGPAVVATPRTTFSDEVDAFGNRIRRFVAPAGETTVTLSGIVRDNGVGEARSCLQRAQPVEALPVDVLPFLAASRYCEVDLLGDVAWAQFGHLPRTGLLVQAICDVVQRHLTFDYSQACATRTAAQAYQQRAGVCRDFAHLAITLCRCLAIPARYVNGYLGDVGVPYNPDPMDFNAWFEVYLDGGWQTYDARHNQPRIGRLPIARGRDAADVPILQTFGPHVLTRFEVVTEEVRADEALAA